MSKRARERDIAPELFDFEFERALEETERRQRGKGRRIEQKTQQLCRQVQRALNLALASHYAGSVLDDVFVIHVLSAAGCSRLVAHVAVPAGRSVRAVLKELGERAPLLRAVVAGYISRKRAPELSFAVTPSGNDAYE